MSEHTKGRLSVGYSDRSGPETLVNAEDHGIATVLWGCGCCKGDLTAADQANARRLAACWNALERYTTEAIEQSEATLRAPTTTGVVLDKATSKSDTPRAIDPRDPDHRRPPPFDYHNCAGCNDGRKPCRFGHANPRDCDWLHARND